jgi:cell division protein FtsZ
MDSTQQNPLPVNLPQPARVFAVGTAGLNVAAAIPSDTLAPDALVAVHSDSAALDRSSAAHRVLLESKGLAGLGLGGDPERGRAAAEEQFERFKQLSMAAPVVVIATGLGGAAGTGAAPIIARAAREAGAHVVVFAILPFDCEGSLRLQFAADSLHQLRNFAHLVIDLPNQKAAASLDAAASLVQTFAGTNRLLADCIQGVITSLNTHCVMGLPFVELSRVTHLRSLRCAFALVESSGPDRAQAAVENILRHPMLDHGQVLRQAQSVAVSIVGGHSLSMVEVNSIMDQVNRACRDIPVMMGACVASKESDTLRVGFLVALANEEADGAAPSPAAAASGAAEDLPQQLLNPKQTARPGSRFVPPAPEITPDKIQSFRQAGARARKAGPKLRQGQLPLDIVSKGRFDNSEPTIHKGEDLDLPTYIRRGIQLN